MATPRHRPTKESRLMVKTLAGYGVPQKDICVKVGISNPTLQKYYRHEMDLGVAEANAAVSQRLWKIATGTSSKAVTAAIFWLKTRCGWRDVNVHEHSGLNGTAIEVGDARSQLAALIARHKDTKAVDEVPEENGKSVPKNGKKIPVRRRRG